MAVLWLNYNSMKILNNIVIPSLKSVLGLERGPYEQITVVIDGGSTDGSDLKLREYIKGSSNAFFVKSPSNEGYAGNMNFGYNYAVSQLGADYVVFLNNDFIVRPSSLRRMYEWLINNGYAGVQGLELAPNNTIGNAGMLHDEFAMVISICSGYTTSECDVSRPYKITFAIGSYMLYAVDAINEMPEKTPFITETFAGFDDNYLGLMMWNKGFTISYVPVEEGIHYGSATTRSIYGQEFKQMTTHQGMKTRIALWENMKCKHQTLFNIYRRRIYIMYKLSGKDYLRRSVKEGLELARIVRNKAGIIDLEKAVHIEFLKTYYVMRAFLPRTSSLITLDTHINYLNRYIKIPKLS